MKSTAGLCSCIALVFALAGCRSLPEEAPPVVSDPSTFLGLAVDEVSRLEDRFERADLYAAIAEGYARIDDPVSLRNVLRRALSIGREAGDTEEAVRVRVQLVPLLDSVDDPAAAAIIPDAVGYVDRVNSDQVRALIVPLIVESALASGESIRANLRSAVDQALIIENPVIRVETILRVAELYQAGGVGLSVAGLIQQAIPAARSVASASRRILLFARLSRLAASAQENALVSGLGRIVRSEIDALGAERTSEDERYLIRATQILAGIGADELALRTAGATVSPYAVVRSGASISGSAEPGEDRLGALERLATNLPSILDLSARVDAQLVLAAAFAEAGAIPRATALLSEAQGSLIANPRLQDQIDALEAVAVLRVRLDQIGPLTELLDGARDEYIRGVIALAAAEELINEGRLGLSDDFLVVALLASDEAAFLSDALRVSIVSGFVRTGSVRLAIRTIERISDRLLRARAVVDLAVRAEPAGLMTSILRSDLASALAGR